MRDIKFRGKRVDNGEWVYGYYITRRWDGIDDKHFIVENRIASNGFNSLINPVHPDTVGQWIDHKDDDGKDIFEGDLVVANDTFIDEVAFGNGGFIFKGMEPHTQGTPIVAWSHLKVIGTIHDKEPK